jgi:hypothetical protein
MVDCLTRRPPAHATQERTQADWTNAEAIENRRRLGTSRSESAYKAATGKVRAQVQKEVARDDRRLEMIRLRVVNRWTLQRIANKFNLSRQRVHQIITG